MIRLGFGRDRHIHQRCSCPSSAWQYWQNLPFPTILLLFGFVIIWLFNMLEKKALHLKMPQSED